MSKELEAFEDIIIQLPKTAENDNRIILVETALKTLELLKGYVNLGKYTYKNNNETYGLEEYYFFISKDVYELLRKELK